LIGEVRQLICLDDFEVAARAILPPHYFDFFAGGAEGEWSLAANRSAHLRRVIRYHVLVDVAQRDLSLTLFGSVLPHPIVLAPTAYHRLAHPDGELATARGAAASGAVLTVSTVSTVPLEEVATAGMGSVQWFQLYSHRDRPTTEALVRRADRAGYQVIVITADIPAISRRERDLRNNFSLPPGVRAANFDGSVERVEPIPLTWSDITWIKSLTGRPVVVKGIVRPDDALRAVDAGADGIWVSNHGGRQLDCSIPPIDALEAIVTATDHAVPIVVDGGIRRGTDVVKALALGADVVAIGRPQVWGLAVGGSDGVQRVVEILRDELSIDLALTGCRALSDITRDIVEDY
jgi:4-hydroxymandelate oxidase